MSLASDKIHRIIMFHACLVYILLTSNGRCLQVVGATSACQYSAINHNNKMCPDIKHKQECLCWLTCQHGTGGQHCVCRINKFLKKAVWITVFRFWGTPFVSCLGHVRVDEWMVRNAICRALSTQHFPEVFAYHYAWGFPRFLADYY